MYFNEDFYCDPSHLLLGNVIKKNFVLIFLSFINKSSCALKIQSVLLGNPQLGLVTGRVYFDELITSIVLKVDWIGPQRKKLFNSGRIITLVIKYIENL